MRCTPWPQTELERRGNAVGVVRYKDESQGRWDAPVVASLMFSAALPAVVSEFQLTALVCDVTVDEVDNRAEFRPSLAAVPGPVPEPVGPLAEVVPVELACPLLDWAKRGLNRETGSLGAGVWS